MSFNKVISFGGFLIWAFTLSPDAFASKCVNQILKNNGWDQVSQSQVECLVSNKDFQDAVAELCNEKQTAPSERFKKYLELESEYKTKLAAYSNEVAGSSQFDILMMELRQIEMEWKIDGHKREVEIIKWTLLKPAAESCQIKR